MNRTALRLATLAALTGGGAEPWPTLAEDYVYDSRRDHLEDVNERMRRPVIVIRTDNDVRTNRGPNGAYTSQQIRQADLLLEISVVSAKKAPDPDNPGQFVWHIGWPQTDPALEATLDMLEYQIENALFGLSPWAVWWRSRFTVFEYTSVPEFSREPNLLRLAARTISLTLRLPQSCLPGWRYEDEPDVMATMPKQLLDVISKIEEDGAGDLLTAVTQIKNTLNGIGWPEETAFPQLLRVATQITVGRETV